MWLFTPSTGFLSIVQHDDDPELLTIRARAEKDLEPIRATLGALGHPNGITVYHRSDYPFRVFATKAIVKMFMAAQVELIDYGNFKAEVARKAPTARERAIRSNAYHAVWEALLELEELNR